MKKLTQKFISIIFSILLLISVGFSTNVSATENSNTKVTTSNNVVNDVIYFNSPYNSNSPSNLHLSSRLGVNILTNYITVNCRISGSTVKVAVRNVAVDSLDSMVVNIKAYRDGRLQINRTFSEYNVSPFSAPTFEVSLPGISYAEVTVTTTDGGESYTKYYTVNA